MTLTRRAFITIPAATLAAARLTAALGVAGRTLPRPTASQLAWQRDELALFLHVGVNTFTDREWGDGHEDPAIFNPARLDARQWARSARQAGFKAMLLTAKHHDGFCLWPSKTTRHSVASSPWRNGRGDVVGEFVEACRAEGLKAGLYLSPWDRHEPSYGDSPRYNDLYNAQLTELLTSYGPIHEVWFDGANGEGPNGRRQVYDWPRVWGLVRQLQPQAVMFSDAGPDIRWIGNERGTAGATNWSTVDPAAVPYPGASGEAVDRMLQNGDPRGTVWRPGETDVSIRPGWFYHPAEDDRVRTADDLVNLYFSSVGRNSKLLLNVPPMRDGLLNDTDVAHLLAMRAKLEALFEHDLASGQRPAFSRTGATSTTTEVTLDAPAAVTIADLQEPIEEGQVVARYRLEGLTSAGWQQLSAGTTIGCRKLDRFAPTIVTKVRLCIDDALDAPPPIAMALYAAQIDLQA
jgi:alpha-L-fucosidase